MDLKLEWTQTGLTKNTECDVTCVFVCFSLPPTHLSSRNPSRLRLRWLRPHASSSSSISYPSTPNVSGSPSMKAAFMIAAIRTKGFFSLSCMHCVLGSRQRSGLSLPFYSSKNLSGPFTCKFSWVRHKSYIPRFLPQKRIFFLSIVCLSTAPSSQKKHLLNDKGKKGNPLEGGRRKACQKCIWGLTHSEGAFDSTTKAVIHSKLEDMENIK